MEVQVLEREFNYNGVKLPDPNPQMSVEEVKEMYSAQYPELLTGAIEGPEVHNAVALHIVLDADAIHCTLIGGVDEEVEEEVSCKSVHGARRWLVRDLAPFLDRGLSVEAL